MLALALAAALFAAPPTAAKAPKKYALLVGISDYGKSPGVPELEQWSELPGSRNDITVLEAELKAQGFEVTTLVDAAATRDAIRAAFRSALVDKVKTGDIAVFHFSGHGQQIPDDDGAPDEADGYDESIIPYDNKGTVDYSGHLRDDELGKLLADLSAKTPNVTVFIDSCNSGTGTRAGGGWERGAGPTHPAAATRGAAADGASGFAAAGTKSRLVFISAAHSTELAKEVVDPSSKLRMGAFTYLLTKVLRNARLEQRAVTGREVADEIAVRLPGLVKKQNATVEGDVDRHLFGTGTVPSASYLRVRPPDASGVMTVEGGTLAGLVPRTTVALYPADATVFDESKALATAKVESADATTAKLGKPTPALDAIATAHGLRAQVSRLSAVPDPLRLKIDAVPDVAASAARASPAVTVVEGDAFDVRLTTDSAGGVVLRDATGEGIGFPRGSGKPMDPSLSASDPTLGKRVTEALLTHAKRTRLLALENALPSTNVAVDLLLRSVRIDQPPGGAAPVVVPGSALAPGAPLKAGQGFQLGVKNRSKSAVYVSIVVLGPDGSIDLLFPAPNAGLDNRVRAGEERWFPPPFGLTPPAGTQIFKLFATSEQASFASLAGATREGESSGAAPFDGFLGGSIGAFTVRADPPAAIKWGADSMQVELVE